MTHAYFDCFSGVAGDMVLGALLDLGLPLAHLKQQLGRLSLTGYRINLIKEKRPVRGTNVRIDVKEDVHPSDYKSIDLMIARSKLSKPIKDLSRAIFERLAKAEAKIHGIPITQVHFHEVGATDSIIDIVGAAIGFDYFKFKEVHSSPIPMTRGRIRCAHGVMPAPAPATLELLKGAPLERSNVKGEIVTPTGAAILATVVNHFGECPIQEIKKIGYGYGDRKFPGMINALRLIAGEGFPVVVIECDIDDMNPQIFDYVMNKIFDVGAVDVGLIPIQMKKNRPAIRVHVVASWEKKDAVMDVLLKETTTFGVRYFPVERRVLTRKIEIKKTKFGSVRFKTGVDSNGKILKEIPEYEDVVRLARRKKRPLLSIYTDLLDR